MSEQQEVVLESPVKRLEKNWRLNRTEPEMTEKFVTGIDC
jgi:hypothetical protein